MISQIDDNGPKYTILLLLKPATTRIWFTKHTYSAYLLKEANFSLIQIILSRQHLCSRWFCDKYLSSIKCLKSSCHTFDNIQYLAFTIIQKITKIQINMKKVKKMKKYMLRYNYIQYLPILFNVQIKIQKKVILYLVSMADRPSLT